MIELSAFGDLAFVAAAYGVILGGIGVYAVRLGRRLRNARHASSAVGPEATRSSDPSPEHPA